MAKKQTRRSISVSRSTYERLNAFCEANNISMSQFVETRVGDFLGEGSTGSTTESIIRDDRSTPLRPSAPSIKPVAPQKSETRSVPIASSVTPQPVPMTSAAARFVVEPPPPVIKRKDVEEPAPKPAEKRPDQIFTF